MPPIVTEFAFPGGLSVEVPGTDTINALGHVVTAAPSTVVYDPIAVHVATTRDMQRLPEADRTTETIALYSVVSLRTAGGSAPYIVTYGGRRYVVSDVSDHDAQGGVWHSLAKLEQTTA